jgi:hypothetical protein
MAVSLLSDFLIASQLSIHLLKSMHLFDEGLTRYLSCCRETVPSLLFRNTRLFGNKILAALLSFHSGFCLIRERVGAFLIICCTNVFINMWFCCEQGMYCWYAALLEFCFMKLYCYWFLLHFVIPDKICCWYLHCWLLLLWIIS